MIPDDLAAFIHAGIPVIATLANGATEGSWADPGNPNWIKAIDHAERKWAEGARRFQYLPAASRLLVLDLDRKDGKDGLQRLAGLLYANAILFDLADAPVWIETPNAGRQILFRCERDIPSAAPWHSADSGIDILTSKHLATAAGSAKIAKDGQERPYILHGDLAGIPALPPRMASLFMAHRAMIPQRKYKLQLQEDEPKGRPSFAVIESTLAKQGTAPVKGNLNNYAFAFAKWAKNAGYDGAEIAEHLAGKLEDKDFTRREIAATVRSAGRK